MKILHVITTIDRGGAENHLCDLVKGLAIAGNEVGVAYLKGNGYWGNELESYGIRVFNLGLVRYGDFLPIWRLRKLLYVFHPEIVHAHLPPAEIYTRLALLGIQRPSLVISKHVDSAFLDGSVEKDESAIGSFLTRIISQRAERVICISNSVRNFLASSQVGVPLEKLEVVNYGLCIKDYHLDKEANGLSVRAEFSIGGDALLIGTVARLVPQKSLHHLLYALNKLVYEHNKSVNLLIVGSGPLERQLLSLAETLGVQDRVIWAGFREDIPRLMSALDIFVLCSRNEGFGLVLLEAMASSLPVVASRISAIPEVVKDGVTGFLFRYGDVDSCVDAILNLQDLDTRVSFGVAGRKRVEQEFSVSRMNSRMVDIYEEVRGK